MTPEQFLEWIDKEINLYKRMHEEEKDTGTGLHSFLKGEIKAFTEVREKFLTLTPPPTTLS